MWLGTQAAPETRHPPVLCCFPDAPPPGSPFPQGYRPQYAAELVALPLRPDTVQRRTYGLQMMRQCLAAPKAQEYDRARAQLAKVGPGRSLPVVGCKEVRGVERPVSGSTLCSPERSHTGVLRSLQMPLLTPVACPPLANLQLEEMLRAARLGLTAAEQIELYPHVLRSPSLAGNSAAASAATYDAALAYVSEGFALRMPHLVAKAEKLLQKVEAHAAREPGAQQVGSS